MFGWWFIRKSGINYSSTVYFIEHSLKPIFYLLIQSINSSNLIYDFLLINSIVNRLYMLCITFSRRFDLFDEIILLHIWIVIVFLKQIIITFLAVKSPVFIPSCVSWASFFISLVISVILRIGISSKVDFLCLPRLLSWHIFISLHTCRSIRISLHISCRVCPSSCISSFVTTRHGLIGSLVNRKVVSFSVLHEGVIDRASLIYRASCVQRVLLSSHIYRIFIGVPFHFIWKMRVDIVLKSLFSIFEHLTLKL